MAHSTNEPMPKTSQAGLISLSMVILLLAGCHKQPKPQPIVPPPMLTLAMMIPVPTVLPPDNEPPVVVKPPTPPLTVAKTKPKKNSKKITDLPKTTGATSAANTSTNATPAPADTTPAITAPPRITTPVRDVPNGTAITDLPHSDEQHHRQTAAQLNQSTEETLRGITRALTTQEKSIVEQIRSFMAQSQAAIADNDLVRAHNLALKAHLLSDELAHR